MESQKSWWIERTRLSAGTASGLVVQTLLPFSAFRLRVCHSFCKLLLAYSAKIFAALRARAACFRSPASMAARACSRAADSWRSAIDLRREVKTGTMRVSSDDAELPLGFCKRPRRCPGDPGQHRLFPRPAGRPTHRRWLGATVSMPFEPASECSTDGG